MLFTPFPLHTPPDTWVLNCCPPKFDQNGPAALIVALIGACTTKFSVPVQVHPFPPAIHQQYAHAGHTKQLV